MSARSLGSQTRRIEKNGATFSARPGEAERLTSPGSVTAPTRPSNPAPEDPRAPFEVDLLRIERKYLKAESNEFKIEERFIQSEIDQVRSERDQMKLERDQLRLEREQLIAERNLLIEERDQFKMERNHFLSLAQRLHLASSSAHPQQLGQPSVFSPLPQQKNGNNKRQGGFSSVVNNAADMATSYLRLAIYGDPAAESLAVPPVMSSIAFPMHYINSNWVVVRIWLPGREGLPSRITTVLREDINGAGVGHVSLEVPGRYWSWWPTDEMNVSARESVVGVPGKHKTLKEDEDAEREYDPVAKDYVPSAEPRKADIAFFFRSLDLEQIGRQMALMDETETKWNVRTTSCATTVAALIRAGCSTYGERLRVKHLLDKGISSTARAIAPDGLARALWTLANRREISINVPNPPDIEKQFIEAEPPRLIRLCSSGEPSRGIIFSRYNRDQIRWRNLH